MASSVKASAPASMYLDTRIPEGQVVVCTCAGEEHSFMVARLGVSVECPTCGRTALSANLIDDYYARANRKRERPDGDVRPDEEAYDGDDNANHAAPQSETPAGKFRQLWVAPPGQSLRDLGRPRRCVRPTGSFGSSNHGD
jgi:hypothetical protein